MPLCDICGEDVTSPAHHKSERHSTPAPIEIFGVLTEFHRDADDNLLCPIDSCSHKYPRRSSTMRHLKRDHDVKIPGEKRSFSSSLESLSDGVHKKARVAIENVTKVIKSKYLFSTDSDLY
jgi:hypothetical protein